MKFEFNLPYSFWENYVYWPNGFWENYVLIYWWDYTMNNPSWKVNLVLLNLFEAFN